MKRPTAVLPAVDLAVQHPERHAQLPAGWTAVRQLRSHLRRLRCPLLDAAPEGHYSEIELVEIWSRGLA